MLNSLKWDAECLEVKQISKYSISHFKVHCETVFSFYGHHAILLFFFLPKSKKNTLFSKTVCTE